MSSYLRWSVFIAIAVLISVLIFFKGTSRSLDAYFEFEYPVGSFEIHMFFEQYGHSS